MLSHLIVSNRISLCKILFLNLLLSLTVAVQPNGKILVYDADGSFKLLNSDGSADSTFQPTFSIGSSGLRVEQQPDGKILASGRFDVADGFPRLYITRFNIDGTLDTGFAPTGAYNLSVFNEIFALNYQPDGKILAGGLLNIPGVRLNSTGALDITFPEAAYAKDVKVLPDGKIVFVGLFRLFKIFNPDGSLYADYSSRLDDNAALHKILVQPDGKMWIVGKFSSYLGTPRGSIAKLNSDATLDSTFNPPGSASGENILDIDIQSDGKIVVGGEFQSFNFNSGRKRIARINPDGSLDTSFTTTVDYPVYTLKINAADKIFVGGDFLTVNGVAIHRIARLNSNGTLDNSFNIGSGANARVYNINLQSDGKILLVGDFTQINGIPRFGIARLLNAQTKTRFDFDGDGRADTSVFRPDGGFWYRKNSFDNTFSGVQFGQNGDFAAPADYDGDGKTDIAVFREGFWYLLRSQQGFTGLQFGSGTDKPIPAIYNN